MLYLVTVRLVQGLTILVAVATLLLVGTKPGRAALAATLGSCSYTQIREGDRVAAAAPTATQAIVSKMALIRKDGDFQFWSTPQGNFWYHGEPTSLDVFVLTEEESDLYETDRIHGGAIVLDCGANYGTFTRRALERGAGKVIAIEIDPQIQEALRRTFAQEIREGRVVVYGKGVWDHDSTLTLRSDSVVLERAGPPKPVEVTTIDHIAAELQLPSVDFIKMDIEGSEKNALRGATDVLRRYAPTLAISSEHLPDDTQRIPELISQLTPQTYTLRYGYCVYDRPYHADPKVLQFAK